MFLRLLAVNRYTRRCDQQEGRAENEDEERAGRREGTRKEGGSEEGRGRREEGPGTRDFVLQGRGGRSEPPHTQ